MVCDLSQNNLKENLENYVNALIEENFKNPTFSYTDIINIIKQDAFEENNDLSQALGIAYHVPQMIYDIIKNNPEYNEKEFVKKGYDSTKLINEINNLEEAEDKIKAIATMLGITNTSVAEMEEVISQQPSSNNTVYIKAEGSDSLSIDNALSNGTWFATTIQTAETEMIDGKEVINLNVRKKNELFYQDMLSRIILARKDADQDFTEVEYDGKKGFRGVIMLENQIPGTIRSGREFMLTRNVPVLVITDNQGNIRYFDEKTGKITDKENGKPLYQTLKKIGEVNATNITNSLSKHLKNLSKEEQDIAKAKIRKQVDEEGKKLQEVKDKSKQGPVLVDLIGGSIGVAQTTDNLDPEIKHAVEANLSEFDENSYDPNSIIFDPFTIKGARESLPAIKFKTIKGHTTLKNTEKIGEQDPQLLNDIVNILTEDVGLTDTEKFNYIGQFINLNKKANPNDPSSIPYSIGINASKGNKLYMNINGKNIPFENKELAKQVISDFLGKNVPIHFKDELYRLRQYDKITLQQTATGYSIVKREQLPYLPFIFSKFTPRVAYDKTSGFPAVNNGYFIFSPVITQEEINKQIAETTAKLKEENIPTNNTEQEEEFDDLKSSRLIEDNSTAEQNAKAENWWRNESALSKAVDENGKPLLSLNLLRNVVNSDAWATFSGSVITLYKGAKFSQVYHESWHAFSQVYLTKDQRTALYKDVSNLKGSFEVVKRIVGPGSVTFKKVKVNFKDLDFNKRPDRILLEEFIAEEFRKYALNDGKFNTKSEKNTVLGRIFDRIWRALKALVGNTDIYTTLGSDVVLKDIFNKLYTAKDPKELLPYSPNLTNAEFGLLNSGGIVSEDAESNISISEGLLLSRTIDGILSQYVTEKVQKGSFSAATKIFSSRKNLTTIYNEVKDKFNNERNILLARKSKIPATDVQELSIIDNKINLFTRALTLFGDINKALAGESAEASVIAFHRNNSTFKDLFSPFKLIKNEEGDSDNYEETSDSSQQELATSYDQPTNGVASEKLANDTVLYLIKSLLKQDKEGNFELNELGFAEPIEFLPFWRVLMDKASGETSILGLYNKLKLAGDTVSPLFNQLLSKIYVQQTKLEGTKVVNLSPEDSLAVMIREGSEVGDLWMKFVQSTNLHKVDLIVNYIQANTNGTVDIRVGKTSDNYQKIINTDWPVAFQQKEKDSFTTRSNQVNYIDLEAVANRFLIKGTNTQNQNTYIVAKENYIPFLNSIGLYVDNISEIKEILKPDDINFIADAIGKTNDNAVGDERKISNVISYLNVARTLENGTRIPHNAYAVIKLAELQAAFSTEYSTSMKYTPENTLKSTHATNSTDTQKINPIKKSTKIGDLFTTDPEFIHMNSFNPVSNPLTKGLILFKSLYSTVTGEKLPDNDINYRDLSGTTFVDSEYVSNGKSYAKMGFLDKVLSTFISTLGGGYIEGIQAGDKSSNFAIKLNYINTYKGKVNDNLYVDTVAFITDKDGKSIMGIDPMQKVLEMLYPKLEGEIRRIAMVKADPAYYDNIKGFENGDEFDIFDEILDEETGSLKDTLKSEETYEQLLEKGTLYDLLVANPLLKEKIDKEILTYFDKIEESYNKDLFDPIFGKDKPMPSALRDLILKDLSGNKSELDNIYGKDVEDKELNIKKAAIRSYMINNFIHKTETTVFLQGDSFQFDHTAKEMTKRTPGSQSGGTIFPVDKLTQIFIDAKVGRPYEQKLIADKVISEKDVRSYGPTLNTAIIEESKVTSAYFALYEELFENDFKKKGLKGDELAAALYGVNPETGLPGSDETDSEGNYIDVHKGGKMDPFVNIKDGDGQGWMSFDTYRILKRAEGNWSDAQEELFFKIVNGEEIDTSKITDMFPVYKLQYNGALATEVGRFPVQAFHKFSLFPLIPNVIKNFPAADTLHKAMISQNIDYALFPSGSKRSYIKSSPKSKGDAIYNGTTNNIKPLSEIEFTKNTIYISYLKNQTAVNSYYKSESTFSSQLRKLITSFLYENGVPVDYIQANGFKTPEEAIENWEEEPYKRMASPFHDYAEELKDSIEDFVEYKKKELLDELGWTEDDLYAETVDDEKLESLLGFLDKEFARQGFSEHERSPLIATSNFNKVDISTSPLAARFEKMIMAIVNNRIIKPKLKGEPLVELSSAFMQDANFRKPTLEEIAKYDDFGGTNGLASYVVDPSGKYKTRGFMFKRALNKMDEGLFQLDYFTKNADGEYVNAGEAIAIYKPRKKGEQRELDLERSLDRLNEMLQVKDWRMNDDNYKKLRLTGVRIPVQGHNSMEFGEVAQFLNPSAGPVIIIPAEIVAKSGTDFDVDKMTTYMPFLTRSGKLMEKMNEEDVDEKEEELKTKFDKLVLNEKVIEVLKKDKSEKWLDINFKLNNFRKAVRLAGKKIDEKTLETLSSNKSKVIIKAMDEPGMEEYVKNFIPKAYNIYIKNIKGVTLENLETVEDALEIIYNEKSQLSEVFTERSDLNDHKNNMLGGIQNKLIQDMVNILELPHLAASLMSPNDTNLSKPTADKLEGYIQKADNESDYTVSVKTGKKMYKRGISPTKVYTQNYNIKRHQENFSSKDSLGIAAIDNYINNLLNMAGGVMEKSMNVSAKAPIKTEEGFKWPKNNNTTVEVNIDLNLPHNKLNGAISLSHVMDKLKTNSIADIISQLMNGFVDVGKDAWVAYLQGNVDVVPKFLFLLQTGVPFKHIAYLVSNPMTRQYIKDKANGKAVLSPLIPSIAKSYDVAGNMLNKIEFSDNVLYNLDNIYGLQEALKEKAKSSDFTEEALERVAQKSLDYNDREQIAGFLEYLYIENLIEDYDAMKKAMNPDTKNSPDLYSAQAKIEEVQGLMDNPSISEPVINKLATNSIISPFFIQEFARRLFSRLFKLRDDSQVNNFLISIFKDRTKASKAKKVTGFDTETYIAKFKNFIAQYIFANELRVYKSGDTVYKGMPITPEVLEQLNQDFDKGLYLRSNANSDSYESRNLAPISAQAFPGIVKKDNNDQTIVVPNEKLRADFIEFGLEREYLRQTMPLESVKNTKEFETRRKRLMASGYSEYRQNDGESAEEYMDRLNGPTYEDMLANKALTNTYNIWQLFRSGDNTIAQELMDIITNYPEMGKSTKYSMLQQFMPLGIPNDALYKNISNFMLKNYSNLDEGLISEYNNQWNDLANPNKDKVIGNKEANIYISNFFENLPLYAFLQSGMDSGKFSLASVMPYGKYKEVMDRASEKFIDKLETTDSDKILKGLKQLFEIENSGKNKKLRGRGPLLKVDISNLPDAEYSIYEQPFIERVVNDNNIPIGVFNITNNYNKDGRVYPVTREQMDKLITNNPSVIFLLSPADLIKLTNVLTTDEINNAKININDTINKIISTGTDVVIYPEGFGDSAKKFFDNIGAAEGPKKQVTTEYPIEPGRFVTNNGVTYITIKKNDNGTWQVYNPNATGANSKKSFAESNLTTSFIKAVKVRYRDADYLVTPKDTIISLTTGTKMDWKDNDGNRIAILKLKDTKPVTNEPVIKAVEPIKVSGNTKVVSEPYGVVVSETAPSESKTKDFINLIQPQIKAQAYQENKTGNKMFMYGLRWTRKSKASKPLNNKSYANKGLPITDAKATDGYVYDTVDQNGNALAPVSDLKPIIAEIEKSLGIDMSNYDAVIGNIYLPGQRIQTHRDTTESLSARNYPVVVYTIGAGNAINIYEDEKNPGSDSFAYNKKTSIPTKNGTIYTFGMNGKGRFELGHDTPHAIKKTDTLEPITMPNGDVIRDYTITLTFRRAADLTPGMPTTPSKTGVKAPVSTETLPGSDTKINIYAGTGENAELSNFANRPFTVNGFTYPSVEHGFQMVKAYRSSLELTEQPAEVQDLIKNPSKFTAAQAKAIGRKIKGLNTEEWDKQSLVIMKAAIRESFKQNPDALAKLLATGNATLTHTQDKGKWGKEFPRLLMEVREELRATQPQAPVTNEVKGSIQLQLIEDLVQQGKAKTTVRRYDKESGIYKSEAGNLYNLVNRGKVRMVGDKIIGKGIAYTLDEFGAAEGFGDWAGFVKAAKYAGIDIQTGKEVFLYDITPAGKAADKVRPVFDSLPIKSSTPTMTYAGIGSRETPQEVLDKMTEVAKYLDGLGYTLNTGKTFTAKPSTDPKYQKQYEERLAFSKKNNGKVGLDEEGADRAFSLGTTKKNLFGVNTPVGKKEMSVMEEIHPSPDRLKEGGKKLMARNTNQIFGENLNTPVDFVLFYAKETKGIRPEGGTGQAVEMARRKGIPTINMADTNWRDQLKAAIANKPAQETLDFKTMPDFTIDRKREILSNFALKHGITKDEAYKYINEAFNNPTKNKEDIIKKLKECY